MGKNKITKWKNIFTGKMDKKNRRRLICFLVILVIVIAGRLSYGFAYDVFDQEAMADQQEAVDVEVVIEEGMSVYQVGKLLAKDGLIKKPLVFWFQERFSDYHGQIKAGTYTLSTGQTVGEILRTLSSQEEEQ